MLTDNNKAGGESKYEHLMNPEALQLAVLQAQLNSIMQSMQNLGNNSNKQSKLGTC